MVHVCCITELEVLCNNPFACRKDHKLFLAGDSLLAEPVAADFEVGLRTGDFEEDSLEVVVIEFQGI